MFHSLRKKAVNINAVSIPGGLEKTRELSQTAVKVRGDERLRSVAESSAVNVTTLSCRGRQ